MTLEEAIKHAEEIAQEKQYEYQECLAVHDMENAMDCGKCGEEHEQLAEWLRELKERRVTCPLDHFREVTKNDVSDKNVGDIDKFIDGLVEIFANIRKKGR